MVTKQIPDAVAWGWGQTTSASVDDVTPLYGDERAEICIHT